MTRQARGPRVHERWAHLRFAVIGQLLAAPPPKGELRAAIEALAAHQWRHPTTGDPVRFSFSTIERWLYRALKERSDPVGVLRRKLRTDAGQQPAVSEAVRQVVLAQYAAHKSWSVQLHHDNLVALAETRADLRPLPCYDTLRRFMKANGLDKRRRVTSRQTAGADRAEARLFDREIRGPRSPGHDAQGGPCRSLGLGRRPRDFFVIMLLQFPRPHHALRPRDRYRTITPLLLIGVLPEPMHAALSDAEISTITQLARVPGKELPQEAPSGPVPICPPPTLADLHDAHPHPGFTMWQHSAHVEKPPVLHKATQLSGVPPCGILPDRG